MTTIEPVVEIARRAKAAGTPIAVASGGSTTHVTEGLRIAGILDLFEVVICAEVCRCLLLNPQTLKHASHKPLSH